MTGITADRAAPVGLYVHLPFCASKSAYCDFPSYAGQEARRGEITAAVMGQISGRAATLA